MRKPALSGLKVAIPATDGFEQSELLEPRKALSAAGASVKIVSPEPGALRGWGHKRWAEHELPVDLSLDETGAEDFAAPVLPGGVMNPDTLRTLPKASALWRALTQASG
jgi:protease I